MDEVAKAATAQSRDCSQLTHILIIHQYHDHKGALSAFKRRYPRIQVAAGVTEARIFRERCRLRLLNRPKLHLL